MRRVTSMGAFVVGSSVSLASGRSRSSEPRAMRALRSFLVSSSITRSSFLKASAGGLFGGNSVNPKVRATPP